MQISRHRFLEGESQTPGKGKRARVADFGVVGGIWCPPAVRSAHARRLSPHQRRVCAVGDGRYGVVERGIPHRRRRQRAHVRMRRRTSTPVGDVQRAPEHDCDVPASSLHGGDEARQLCHGCSVRSLQRTPNVRFIVQSGGIDAASTIAALLLQQRLQARRLQHGLQRV